MICFSINLCFIYWQYEVRPFAINWNNSIYYTNSINVYEAIGMEHKYTYGMKNYIPYFMRDVIIIYIF